MTSRQYNFYPKINELQKFEDYLTSKGFVILRVPTKKLPFKKTNKLIYPQEKYWPASYITKTELVDDIVEHFVKNQNYYLIDVITSLAIEISLPKQMNGAENLQPGRIYFVTGYYDSNKKWIEKDSEFINEANKMLQWCRRNFKNKY